MMGASAIRSDGRTAAAWVFLIALVLYAVTAAPTIYNLDSAELTTAAATGGIIRATGYPLYLLIGRLWSHFPIGDVGFRLNLMSAFCSAATLAIAAWLLRRAGVSGWAILGGLGLLAVGRYYWAMSLVAEVYSLHTLMVMSVIAALVLWRERPGWRRLAVAAFLTGLSFGNHVATVLLLPGIAVFVLWPTADGSGRGLARLRWPSAADWTGALGGAVAGLSIYAYLPYLLATRPVFNYAGRFNGGGAFEPVDLSTFSGLWWLVTGKSFSHVIFAYTPREMVAEGLRFGGELALAFVAAGIGPGLVGLWVLWRKDRQSGALLLLIFSATAVFYAGYRVVDKNTMFLPSYVVWGLFVAVGLEALFRYVSARRLETIALRAVVGMLVVGALAWNWGAVDLSDDWSARRRAEAVLDALPRDALLIGWWSTVPAVQYLQLVEGRRPDVQAVNRFLVTPADLQGLVWRELSHRPVFLDEPPGPVLPRLEGVRSGAVFQLVRGPAEFIARDRVGRSSLWLH